MAETANSKLIRQLVVGAVIGASLGVVLTKLGWHPPSLLAGNSNHFDYDVEWNRVTPALILWVIFSVYWAIASRNSAPAKSSECSASTYFHQLVLNAALLLLVFPVPGLTGWCLPRRLHFLVAIGVIVQAGSGLLAVWARRHLGRNWSAEVRIGQDHQLVRTGPYSLLRHPIYTAMLGMFLGTAIASSQFHALLGLTMLVVAYLRKIRLEEQILHQTFGAEFDSYRRDTWALVPLLF
ncbi:MAG: isoprenylcysteine carboxylmethyltransferase family protein [Candidatus Acidiferrales bacterium]